MSTQPALDLEGRVLKFQMMELPGQPQMMHMGISYLVSDLWDEVKRLRREVERCHKIYGVRSDPPFLGVDGARNGR